MKAIKNERGLTLVEVLAALVILGIMFVGIMTIFPQMTLFNGKTEAKLNTMNLVREEVADITIASKWKYELIPSSTVANTAVPKYLTEPSIKTILEDASLSYIYEGSFTSAKGPYNRFNKKVNDYLYEVDIYLNCELFQNTVTTSVDKCDESEMAKLYKVHLKLYKENPQNPATYQLSSETYSYITYQAYLEAVAESPGG